MGTYRVVEVTSQNPHDGKKELGTKPATVTFFSPPRFPLEKKFLHHISPSSKDCKKNNSTSVEMKATHAANADSKKIR